MVQEGGRKKDTDDGERLDVIIFGLGLHRERRRVSFSYNIFHCFVRIHRKHLRLTVCSCRPLPAPSSLVTLGCPCGYSRADRLIEIGLEHKRREEEEDSEFASRFVLYRCHLPR